MVTSGVASGEAQRLFHDGAHAALIDVAHGKNLDAGFADVLFFRGVNVSRTHQYAIFGCNFGREIENISEFRWTKPDKRGQRHAVHISTGRSFRSIHVGVGVNPDEADLFILTPFEFGNACHGAGCHRMVAAQH